MTIRKEYFLFIMKTFSGDKYLLGCIKLNDYKGTLINCFLMNGLLYIYISSFVSMQTNVYKYIQHVVL